MSDDNEREQLRTHAKAHALAALSELEQAGFIKRDTRSVLDVDQRTLCALSAAYEIARHWWHPNGDSRTLGTLMKTIPTDEAARITRSLGWAGLLSEDDMLDMPGDAQ